MAANNEVEKAQQSIETNDTIFGKMIRKEIPVNYIYEDEKCIAIDDINPQGPVHYLVIPRKPIPKLDDATIQDTELLGHLLIVAKNIASDKRLKEGYRVVINNGVHGAQSVYHIHVHVIGGRQLQWPPG